MVINSIVFLIIGFSLTSTPYGSIAGIPIIFLSFIFLVIGIFMPKKDKTLYVTNQRRF